MPGPTDRGKQTKHTA